MYTEKYGVRRNPYRDGQRFSGRTGDRAGTGTKRTDEYAAVLSVSQPYEAIRETLPFVQYVQRQRRSDGTGISDPDHADTFSET